MWDTQKITRLDNHKVEKDFEALKYYVTVSEDKDTSPLPESDSLKQYIKHLQDLGYKKALIENQ